jgi:head-tail adaptor
MKSNISISKDGWINISINPETAAEAASLVFHANNADAATRKVSSLYAHGCGTEQAELNFYITLKTKKDVARSSRISK